MATSQLGRTGELSRVIVQARVDDVQSLTRERRPCRARLRFRRFTFESDAAELGAKNDLERAELLGLDKGTYSKIINGRQDPGGKFCAHVLYLFPDKPFERYFEVVEAR